MNAAATRNEQQPAARHSPMKTLQYRLTFLTPAFPGDAERNARWRTPPIKAQLRQWWRVAYAAERKFQVNEAAMREEEGRLFGNAWLENKFCKSQVRLRLERWSDGSLRRNQWPTDTSVSHPEVPQPVGSHLYLGYGPLVYDRQTRKTALKANAAIQGGESALVSLAYPDTPLIDAALWLMDRYGALGGRSRNGWGSYALEPAGDTPALTGKLPRRPWRDCLQLDWPHAIGVDDKGPLIWQTAPDTDWKSLMRTLAVIKIGLRTQFKFPNTSPPHKNIEPRHWLSYPITKHATSAWDRGARLPNQLRFKVREAGDGNLVGVIFHVPHLPPPAFRPERTAIEQVWQKVHRFLDDPKQGLKRIPV